MTRAARHLGLSFQAMLCSLCSLCLPCGELLVPMLLLSAHSARQRLRRGLAARPG